MSETNRQLRGLSVEDKALESKLCSGETETCVPTRLSNKVGVLLSDLPHGLQFQWGENNPLPDYPEQIAVLLSEASKYGLNEQSNEITELLTPLVPAERRAWIEEALRMVKLVERYREIKPKRQGKSDGGDIDFVPGVYELCQVTACNDRLILAKHPHKSKPLSPHTLDGLYRAYLKQGLLVFLPKVRKKCIGGDRRRAVISEEAFQWVNDNWRRFKGPYFLYNALEIEAKKRGWKIPKASWVQRRWEKIPEPIKTLHLEGKKSYVSKYEPYVPRDYSDLEALQVLCGDHSQRDITVSLPNGKLARPWLTVWYDLRTGLIWGWFLSLQPSSQTAAQAYARGVQAFGAQPPSRPGDVFFSYIYTDQGRDYKSRNWDGKVIEVHKAAMKLDAGLEMLSVQRRVGIIDDLRIEHLLARGYNAREKPVERVFRVISEWEQNTFEEYCGRDAKSRPDRWRELYSRHKQNIRGKRSSPFITFERYNELLSEFIERYNSTPHSRPTLGSESIVPIEEYRRLYTTRYEIPLKTLALMLMKAVRRKIGKLGVQCFRKHWFFSHQALAPFKGCNVEVRYSEDDHKRVFIILPNSQICEATLITPTSIINPNQQTLKIVRQLQAHEKAIDSEFRLLERSNSRGENVEDRTARLLQMYMDEADDKGERDERAHQSQVYLWTVLEGRKLYPVPSEDEVSAKDVAEVEADRSIFDMTPVRRFSEFDE